MRTLVTTIVLCAAGMTMLACPTRARADPHCMAHVIADVPAEEAPEQVKSKSNAEFGPVTLIKVNKKTGRMVYCAKDSYCYRSSAFEIVTPCRIKKEETMENATYFSYTTR